MVFLLRCFPGLVRDQRAGGEGHGRFKTWVRFDFHSSSTAAMYHTSRHNGPPTKPTKHPAIYPRFAWTSCSGCEQTREDDMEVKEVRMDARCECGCVWRVHLQPPRKDVTCPKCRLEWILTITYQVHKELAR
jgi:hypothetical protein